MKVALILSCLLLGTPALCRRRKSKVDFRDVVKCSKVGNSFPDTRCLQEEPIGRGSMSLAFLVEHKNTPRVLLIQNKNATEAVRIRQEIGEHPNIIHIDQFRATRKWSFYIIEWGQLGNVSDLRKSHLHIFSDPVFALRFLLKIVEGAIHISDKGFVHSDLKLANIVVDRDYNPKIIDFELATRKRKRYYWRGTTSYMAPEILRGVISDKRFYFTEKIDVYAIGVLFYRMLFGDYPHDERDRTKLLQDIQTEQFYFPEGFDLEMAKIMTGCLRYVEEDRFSLREIKGQIEKALEQKGRKSLWGFEGVLAVGKHVFLEERKNGGLSDPRIATVAGVLALGSGLISRKLFWV